MGVMTKVSNLREGNVYDASPLVEHLIAAMHADEFEELDEWTHSMRAAAECLLFEVESVEDNHVTGGYIVYGHPYNLPADSETEVEVMV